MIDIHSHILMGIDDGSRTLEESIDIIKEAEANGFTQIVSTSHYYKGKFEVEENKRKELLEIINKELIKQNIDVKLYLASEILITPEIIELIETKKASTINDTKYLLMELPFNTQVLYLEDLLFKIIAKGYVPIIAHPERYTFVQKNPNKVIEYIEQGALFQSNYSSVIGYYGKQTQKTAIKLLKANMIHFLGTDVHRPGTVLPEMNNIIKKLRKIISDEKIKELTNTNISAILNQKDIYPDEPTKIKLGIFG